MNNNNIIIAVLVVAVIVLASWFAYKEGVFQGSQKNTNPPEIQINLPGGSPKATSSSGYPY